MKSIYFYQDYRKALLDFYHFKKNDNQDYSYAAFSKQAKLKSLNYLKLVIDGKRNLTISNIHSFAKVLQLQGAEIEYFEAIVLMNQSKLTVETKYYQVRAKNIRQSNAIEVIRTRNSQHISDPLTPVVLICSSRRTHAEATAKVMYELKMSKYEAGKRIDELIESGSLKIDPQNRLVFPQAHEIVHQPHGMDERQKNFLRGGLDEARSVFNERYPGGAAKFFSLLMSASSGSLVGLFNRMKESCELSAEQFSPEADEAFGVYRLQFQVYRIQRNED